MKYTIVQQVLNPEGGGGVSAEYRALLDSELSERYNFVPMVLNGSRPGVTLHDIRHYYRILKDLDPDIIHVRGATVDGLTAIIAAKARRKGKILVTVHGMYSDMVHINPIKKRIAKYIIEPLSFFLADGISCVYEKCAQRPRFRYFQKKMLPHVYNRMPDYSAVDKEEERTAFRSKMGIPKNAKVCVFCGRVTRDKGLEYLLQAIERLSVQWPEQLVFIIVGGGDYEADLRRSFDELGMLGTKVYMTGETKRVVPALCASDFMVLPSLHENHSITLLEAMAMRLPCIATSVGGNPETILDGSFGMLIPAADTENLQAAIIAMCNDEKRQQMVDCIKHSSFEQFSATSIDRQLSRVYEILLQEYRSQRDGSEE